MKRLEGLGALISVGVAKILERYAQDQVVLEIGCFKGGSTVAMAPVAKKIICIDYFRMGDEKRQHDPVTGRMIPPKIRPPTREVFERNVAPWRDKIEVHEMDSLEAVKLDWEPVGFVFIDGGHDYGTVRSDCGFLKWLKVGGHVVFHDMWMKPLARAVNEALGDNLKWKRIPVESELWLGVFQKLQ